MPLRLYYIINCFRHEKPQAGRYREFYQFGVELFGTTSAAADAQIIALGAAFLRRASVCRLFSDSTASAARSAAQTISERS